jgi:hypothetical protein
VANSSAAAAPLYSRTSGLGRARARAFAATSGSACVGAVIRHRHHVAGLHLGDPLESAAPPGQSDEDGGRDRAGREQAEAADRAPPNDQSDDRRGDDRADPADTEGEAERLRAASWRSSAGDRADRYRRAGPWFVASLDGATGYASNKEADLIKGAMVDQIEIPGGEGLAVSPDGSPRLRRGPHVSFGGTSPTAPTGIRVIDTQARSVVAVLPTDNVVVPTHLTAAGRCWRVRSGWHRPARGEPGRHEPTHRGVRRAESVEQWRLERCSGLDEAGDSSGPISAR